MSPFWAFLLGVPFGLVLAGFALWWLFESVSATPKRCLESMATLLRSFERRAGQISIVIDVRGEAILVPFELVAVSIERANLQRTPPEGRDRLN